MTETSSTILKDMRMRCNAAEISQSMLHKVSHMSNKDKCVSCLYTNHRVRAVQQGLTAINVQPVSKYIILPEERKNGTTNADSYHHHLKDHFTPIKKQKRKKHMTSIVSNHADSLGFIFWGSMSLISALKSVQ